MFYNTMRQESSAFFQKRQLSQTEADTLVESPAEFVMICDCLSRAICDDGSLAFKDSKIAAAQMFITFEKNFSGNGKENAFTAFRKITGYRVRQLKKAIAFLRPFNYRYGMEVEDLYPSRHVLSDDNLLKWQSAPIHLARF